MGTEEPSGQRRFPREGWIIILILGAFLAGLPGIFAFPAEQILFNPAAYKQALAEVHAYDQFPLLVDQMIAGGGSVFLFGRRDRLLQILQNSGDEAIMRQVFPADWVRAQADGLIDQFWAYFNFHTTQFKLVVDFRPIKARLTGAQAAPMAAAIVQGFPACQANDLLDWTVQALNGKIDRLPLCRPPAPFIQAADLLVEELLKGSGGSLPDALDLAAVLRLSGAFGGMSVTTAWRVGFQVYHVFRQVDRWLPGLSLALLALAGWLARGSRRGALYWLGVGLLLPGFAGLVTALLVGVWSSQIAPVIIARLFGASLMVFDLLAGMLEKVTLKFTLEATWISLGVALAGALLVSAALWKDKGSKRYPGLLAMILFLVALIANHLQRSHTWLRAWPRPRPAARS